MALHPQTSPGEIARVDPPMVRFWLEDLDRRVMRGLATRRIGSRRQADEAVAECRRTVKPLTEAEFSETRRAFAAEVRKAPRRPSS